MDKIRVLDGGVSFWHHEVSARNASTCSQHFRKRTHSLENTFYSYPRYSHATRARALSTACNGSRSHHDPRSRPCRMEEAHSGAHMSPCRGAPLPRATARHECAANAARRALVRLSCMRAPNTPRTGRVTHVFGGMPGPCLVAMRDLSQ
jgi:hypothetical protein